MPIIYRVKRMSDWDDWAISHISSSHPSHRAHQTVLCWHESERERDFNTKKQKDRRLAQSIAQRFLLITTCLLSWIFEKNERKWGWKWPFGRLLCAKNVSDWGVIYFVILFVRNTDTDHFIPHLLIGNSSRRWADCSDLHIRCKWLWMHQ